MKMMTVVMVMRTMVAMVSLRTPFLPFGVSSQSRRRTVSGSQRAREACVGVLFTKQSEMTCLQKPPFLF